MQETIKKGELWGTEKGEEHTREARIAQERKAVGEPLLIGVYTTLGVI